MGLKGKICHRGDTLAAALLAAVMLVACDSADDGADADADAGAGGSVGGAGGAAGGTGGAAGAAGGAVGGAGGDSGGAGGTSGGSGGASGGEGGAGGAATGDLPNACGPTPEHQSPVVFGDESVVPEEAESCETLGSEWVPCHQHMHCGPEHSGAGICGSAACEVHTVHRKRKDAAEAAEVENLHEGTVGGNCEPAEHDLMVVATFLSFDEACDDADTGNLTYCGSATGNNMIDANMDHVVTCAEAGINPVSVRWCLKTACECHPGAGGEELAETYGEIEATKEQGCPDAPAPALPEACPAEPQNQSPAIFGEGGIEPEAAETCETAGSEWTICHQHMHCGPEHSGAGLCASAGCEVHTVHRKRRDGAEAHEIENPHEGTVGGNCEPAEHDLMVVATFVSFEEACDPADAGSLTYCGSATGNNMIDADMDHVVTCEEAGVNPVSVRWCLKAACECHPGGEGEQLVERYGEIEATKVQGCGTEGPR